MVHESSTAMHGSFCVECGSALEADSRFCIECGSAVEPLAPAVSPVVGIPPAVPSVGSGFDLVAPLFGVLVGVVLGAAISGLAGPLGSVPVVSEYLLELGDIVFVVPVLLGLGAGFAVGVRQNRCERRPRREVAAASAFISSALLLWAAHASGGLLGPVVEGGLFTLTKDAFLGGVIFVIPSVLGALVGWKAAIGNRLISLVLLGISLVTAVWGAMTLWRIYQLIEMVGGLR